MNLVSFAQAVLRRWWLVVILGLIGPPIGYFLDTLSPPKYQSSVSLQLNPAATSAFLPYLPNTSNQPLSNPVSQMAASYHEILRSRTFAGVVVNQLKLRVSPEAIAYSIDTLLVPNTNILRLTVTWDNPRDAEQLAQRIAELFIAENVRRQQSEPGTQSRLSDMEAEAQDMQTRLPTLEQQRQQLDQAVSRGDLSRLAELNNLDTHLTELQTGYSNLLIEISRVRGSFDNAVIIDSATPATPVQSISTIQALIFGLVAGFTLAAAISLLLEYLADAIRGSHDVLAVTGSPPLARIRHVRAGRRWRGRGRDPALVMLHKPRSATAEAFRSLRAALQLLTRDSALRTLVISSPGPHDGKTFVSSNLAVSVAQSGKRVLLVDADLRRPRLHTWFALPNERGLSEVLASSERSPVETMDLPEVLASGIENLSILPAGKTPPNPGELLGSETMAHLLDRLARTWDMVIIDTAPAEAVADTLLLAHRVDGCLVVARDGKTRQASLGAALAALRDARQVVFGVILNDEHRALMTRFNHAHYYQLGPAPIPAHGLLHVPTHNGTTPVPVDVHHPTDSSRN